MDRTKLKAYAAQARRDFIQAVTARAAYHGLTATKVDPIIVQGEVVLIGGKAFPHAIARKRKALEERIARQGFEQTMEAMAYTWFNRFAAIRFMELHGYLDHGYRVLSHPDPEKTTPEILEHAENVDLPGLSKAEVIDLKLDGTREAELYRLLLIGQCNALHAAMPFLFERIDDETELLLPDNLLHSDSLIRKLVNKIDEEDWQEVEILGWLYQFYISEKKDQVIGKVVKSEDIPAATQLFTPNWIVKYLVQNSLGRQWLSTYPNSSLKQWMAYYIEPAEQTPDVQAQLTAMTPESLNPEEITLLDPACGSGHILVEAYELFKAIYQDRGYRARDIPSLILQKNLYGLEIDDRAAQLSAFALMMKARADDRHIFGRDIQPHVLSIQESKGMSAQEITQALNAPLDSNGSTGNISQADVAHLIELFEHGKTFGSLIRVPNLLAEKLPAITERAENVVANGRMFEQAATRSLMPFVEQANLLAINFGHIVMNPPYMGRRNGMNSLLKDFINTNFPDAIADLFAAFICRAHEFAATHHWIAMITMDSWMFLPSFASVRRSLLNSSCLLTMLHLGEHGFDTISGAIVRTAAFTLQSGCNRVNVNGTFVRLVKGKSEAEKQEWFLKGERRFVVEESTFSKLPDQRVVYWLPKRVLACFENNSQLGEYVEPRVGLDTGNNDRFIRYWWEVPFTDIGFGHLECQSFHASGAKFVPHTKGGELRKWYGNLEHILRFDLYAYQLLAESGNHLPSRQFYFLEGACWTRVGGGGATALRYSPQGCVFNSACPTIFGTHENVLFTMALLMSRVAKYFLEALSPTVNAQAGEIRQIPFVKIDQRPIIRLAEELISIAKSDWDRNEQSWDFGQPILLSNGHLHHTIIDSWRMWNEESRNITDRAKELEREIDGYLIHAYELDNEGELTSYVSPDQFQAPNRKCDTENLVSFAIGCMMGRYSLNKPGLIYAASGNKGFDPIQYQTFPADGDGIIPIMETDWFPDNVSNQIVEFISVAWSSKHLEDNLRFIAESLGLNRNEQPRETICRYLTTSFYKHHLSMYKRRPIYWLFSSGRQRAFQCLVYLHRYHEGTLARMRTEYVLPLQGKMTSRIDQLTDDIAAASSTSHRKKLEKEHDTLRKQYTELQAFDEQLRHYADRRISLDLDDGVKVNYGKFGDLLAEVKVVTGEREE